MRRETVVRALLRPAARCLPWTALAAGGGLGLVLVAVPGLFSPDIGVDAVVNLLRMAALGGALAIAFVFDDPARHTVAVLPVPRPLRQGLRVALLLPPVAVWWAVVLGVAAAGTDDVALPVGALTGEAAALCALAVGLAAGAVRFTALTAPGPAAAGTLLALFVAATVLADDVPLLVPFGDDRWESAHRLWTVLLLLASAAWVVCALEPRRRLTPARAQPPVIVRTGRSGR
ncbi:hypothetical protein SAMN04489712_11065 [Thermomonospora echinospora]|uniref:ABC-2 type transport system permease protein n=1 Tax=Thermomonospora echinospora TaxID=1992 RepID=A0A1H6CKR7_9ACTN|nr:ABC transporter [Thermomonospora echinospora]SEG73046.1 hypothetical protein SAMN04489712_11065 [Thermomonospora echinospora]